MSPVHAAGQTRERSGSPRLSAIDWAGPNDEADQTPRHRDRPARPGRSASAGSGGTYEGKAGPGVSPKKRCSSWSPTRSLAVAWRKTGCGIRSIPKKATESSRLLALMLR